MQYLYIPHMCVMYKKKTYTVTKSQIKNWKFRSMIQDGVYKHSETDHGTWKGKQQ